MQAPSQDETYKASLQSALQYLKKLYPEENSNWSFEAEKDGITVYSMYDEESKLKVIRSEGIFKAPAKRVAQIAEEVDVVLEWDKTLEDLKALYRSDDYFILHTLIKKIPFIVQRETILLAKFFHEPDGVIYGAATSLDSHPDVEDSIYRVRAKAHLVGWVLKPLPEDPEQTIFTLILHVDPKGWVPKPAFNWFAQNQGFNVKPFSEYIEKRYNEEKLEKQAEEKEKDKEKEKEATTAKNEENKEEKVSEVSTRETTTQDEEKTEEMSLVESS